MVGRQVPLVLVAASLALAGCIQAPEGDADDDSSSGTAGFFDAKPAASADCAPPTGEGGASGGQGPTGQGGVSNQPGAFSYGGQRMLHTATETYVWTNFLPRASISWGGQSLVGAFELVIVDACGVEVYRGDSGGMQQGGGYEQTDVGTAGDWTITLDFTLYTGQMGLSVTSS